MSQLAPQRRVLADKLPNGDPLDCLGGVINDLTTDSNGGVYFTMGGLFHSDPKGNVTRYGENLGTNGVVLSPDEKTLYVTNSGTVAAFDVQPDGSLTNQRQFVKLPSGGGDGMTIDAQGRLYVTAGPAVHVVAPDGKLLGSIPAPYGLITTAFAGKDKRTLYAVVSLDRPDASAARVRLFNPDVGAGVRGTREVARGWPRRLLSARALQPLVIFFALEAELVDQLRVRLEVLRQVDGERPRVGLGIVDRQLDLEGAEVRAAELFRHLPGVAHRAAPRVDPQVVAEAPRLDDERVAVPVPDRVAVPCRRGMSGKGRPSMKICRYIAFTS